MARRLDAAERRGAGDRGAAPHRLRQRRERLADQRAFLCRRTERRAPRRARPHRRPVRFPKTRGTSCRNTSTDSKTMKLSAPAPQRHRATLLALAIAAACSATPALAAPFIDAQGDFLRTYAGPKDPDLDVRFADVIIDPKAGTATFFGILAGPIDKASGKFYVFG